MMLKATATTTALLLGAAALTCQAFVVPTRPGAVLSKPGSALQGLKPAFPVAAAPASNARSPLVRLQESAQGEDKAVVGTEVPFELRGFSLATVALGVGALITIGSLGEYLLSSGSEGLSGVGFVYGIPILLIGLSLKYAQLDPVPVETSPEADRLFEQKATATIRKIKQDVTRHRYGDDAHLDTTVQALGLVMPNKEFPQLQYLKQGVENGELTFSMVFKSDDTPYRVWVEPERVARYDKFFGPDVWSAVEKVDAQRRLVAIKLTTGQRPASQAIGAGAAAEAAASEKAEA